MKVFDLGRIPMEEDIYDRRGGGRRGTRNGYDGGIYDHYGREEHERRMRELEEREDELDYRERKLEERERRHERDDEMYRRREEMREYGWMGERLYPRDEEEYGPYARRGGGRRGGGRRGSY